MWRKGRDEGRTISQGPAATRGTSPRARVRKDLGNMTFRYASLPEDSEYGSSVIRMRIQMGTSAS